MTHALKVEPSKKFLPPQQLKHFWLIGVVILLLGAISRLWNIRSRPGWEWDEPVYTFISGNLHLHGEMSSKTDYMSEPETYLYHPPFYFVILSEWFGLTDVGVAQARFLAVIGATTTSLLILVLLRTVLGDSWSLIGVSLITVDTWLNFSQRVSWIENTLIPIGVAGIMVYVIARRKDKWWLYVAAGSIMGLTAIYKHIGILFFGAIIIHTLLVRKDWKKNLAAIAAGLSVLGVYAGAAAVVFGPTFVQAFIVQLTRSTGDQESAGALNSLSDTIGPLVGQYRIYIATIALAAIAVTLVVYRLIQIIIKRFDPEPVESISEIYAWALAAVVFFVALQLRFPHYSMLAFIPLFCYLVAELSLLTKHKWQVVSLCVMGILVVIANTFAFHARFIAPQSDMALRDVKEFATKNIPLDAKVIADESVATVIPQEYCLTWRGLDCVDATHIIVYISSTQQPDTNNGQDELVDSGTLLYRTTGFKEEISIYELAEPISPKSWG